MRRTPRLRSSYPSTPGTDRTDATKKDEGRFSVSLPDLPQASPNPDLSTPVIPVHILDAPSQRLYTSAIYCALLGYRLYDWWCLIEEDSTSMTLFLKWCSVDLVFLYGVPMLRIPWLEWPNSISVMACLVHALFNGFLMFRVHIPFESWLLVLVKTIFDREMSISENSVRPARILHNASLIMGKQIINILPEGSATMNPDRLPFCLDSGHPTAKIPLFFNQTKPNYIELIRIDFETNANETIILSSKEIKKIRKFQEENLLSIYYTAKKPGLYRLHKVIDNTKLEVQRRISDTLVVKCPQVSIKSSTVDKCIGDLSDLKIEIEGTPPLKVMYTRIANGDQSVHYFQNVQPEHVVSPLIGSPSALLVSEDFDVSIGRSHRIVVPLNETMMATGLWLYSIDQIHDALGNVANFSSGLISGGDEGERVYPKDDRLEQALTVHDRPVAFLTSCDSRNPLKVAKGKTKEMPIEYQARSRKGNDHNNLEGGSHTITWKFSPYDTLTESGDHGKEAVSEEFFAYSPNDHPIIKQTGLYTLTGVRSRYCEGIVKEPASCLLLNPQEPGISISAESISDNCAGNSVGLLVDLNLIGTPPFTLKYDILTESGTTSKSVEISGLRYQLELKPMEAGHFKYQFISIDDEVYKNYSLLDTGLILEQDVKPPAYAELRVPQSTIEYCLEEPVHLVVKLTGEKPFVLEYEIIHEGRRKKSKITGIESSTYTIKTDPLTKGGEYTLSLTSVQDSSGCKITLNSEAKFTVRRQRPKAAFGKLEGSYKTFAVEGRELEIPLRLTGRAPWTLKYHLVGDETGKVMEKIAKLNNDMLRINHNGKYEIIEVADDQCPGSVDQSSSLFEVEWFPRPQVQLADTAAITWENEKYIKREICEGDIDTLQVKLIGSPPYNVKYQIRHKPIRGSDSIMNKELEAAVSSATIPLESTKAGINQYKFIELSDALYDHDGHKFSPVIVEQKINRKPVAYFAKPGQSYKYCEEKKEQQNNDGEEEAIPIILEGIPPFSLEIDIKHQSNSRPETVKMVNIESNNFYFKIPHHVLSLGIHHVSIRKIQDSCGCQQKTEYNNDGGSRPHVQVQVYQAPTIYPLDDSKTDYCVGDRIAYLLSGIAPFEIMYDFQGVQRKARTSSTIFKRFAEKPGIFTITTVTDKSSDCKAHAQIQKTIHALPMVKISKGRQVQVDIHEGAEAEILFEFWGEPPFEFTYTRSTKPKKGYRSHVLETRHDSSTSYSKLIRSSQEGIYEVIAIKDRYCSFSLDKK